jgi:glycosyltransferase involved in cell wall biosynthesis
VAEGGLVLYDFLSARGGAELVSVELAKTLGADSLLVDYWDRQVFPEALLDGIDCKVLGNPTGKIWQTLRGQFNFRHRARFIKDYDWVVFSGSNAPMAVRHRDSGNLLYCYTIPRMAYDLEHHISASLPAWQRPAFYALTALVRSRYEEAVARMNSVVAISHTVRRRLQAHLGVEATVVHPPCNTGNYRWLGKGEYYLSLARCEPAKRVAEVIKAFLQTPRDKLVVASGGSELPRLKSLAQGADNIHFTGWVHPHELQQLVGRAIATIYVPRDEDFGLAPVESMAAGKPVIGVAEGGLLETVVDGETGMLLRASEDRLASAIAAAVGELTASRASQWRDACEARAERFCADRFRESIRRSLNDMLAG